MGKEFKEVNDYRMYTTKAEVHKAINSFAGIFKGIEIDGIINDKEISEIINWFNLHRHLKDKSPFSEIIPVLDNALMDNDLTPDEVKDILWLCDHVTTGEGFNEYYNLITSSIQRLEGILHGMLADNELSEVEIDQLSIWVDDHEFLKGSYPFDEIDSLLVSVKKDGIITDDEKNILIAFFANFMDTKISYNINEFDVKELQNKYSVQGICAVNPKISFENKTFSFTGTSKQATRNDIAKVILEKGGLFNNNVTNKTNFLIVGDEGNPCWAFSCYGRKVEKSGKIKKSWFWSHNSS